MLGCKGLRFALFFVDEILIDQYRQVVDLLKSNLSVYSFLNLIVMIIQTLWKTTLRCSLFVSLYFEIQNCIN